MTTATLGSMTVEHFDGATGKSVLFSQISITDFAQVLVLVLEQNLETSLENESSQCKNNSFPSPVQTCLVS